MAMLSWAAACAQRVGNCVRWVLVALAGLGFAAAAGAAELPTQSWNGYHWARTGELSISLGDNLTGAWKPFFTAAATQWSGARNIDFAPTVGASSGSACNPIYGTVQVCDGNYGKTGWLAMPPSISATATS